MPASMVKKIITPPKPTGGRVTLVSKHQGGDTKMLIVSGDSNFPEDEYKGSYWAQGTSHGKRVIIEPTFKPGHLKAICQQNNVLMQCIDAMEVNIDGTGHTIELLHKEEGKDETEEEKKEKQIAQDFFDEPYPNRTFIDIRRDLRVDIESIGYGFLVVTSNKEGSIATINHLPAEPVRLLRLDDSVKAQKKVRRGGQELEITLSVRERRFVQRINGKDTYYREFGSSRELNRNTGEWDSKTKPVLFDERAHEIIFFRQTKEPKSPYAIPRWINQLPSILGSRKAEEFNLDFFDAGGLPPALVIVQGGYLAEGMKDTLESYMGGNAPSHRAAVIEALASSGSLDSSGSVKVTVERFGTERQQDSMFQGYDKNCEEHVRVAFRLPPIFLGKAQDYSFASANTSYLTAEAQVFKPERVEFDGAMRQVMRRLGVSKYVFKSNPMALADNETASKAIDQAITGKFATPQSLLKAVNKVGGLDLVYQDPPDPMKMAELMGGGAEGEAASNVPGKKTPKAAEPKEDANPYKGKQIQKSEAPAISYERQKELMEMVQKFARVIGLWGAAGSLEDSERMMVSKSVRDLRGEEKRYFNDSLAAHTMDGYSQDREGLALLVGCAAELVGE